MFQVLKLSPIRRSVVLKNQCLRSKKILSCFLSCLSFSSVYIFTENNDTSLVSLSCCVLYLFIKLPRLFRQTKTTMASQRFCACALLRRVSVPGGLLGSASSEPDRTSRFWPVLCFFDCDYISHKFRWFGSAFPANFICQSLWD